MLALQQDEKGEFISNDTGKLFFENKGKEKKSSLNFAQTVVRKPEFDESRTISFQYMKLTTGKTWRLMRAVFVLTFCLI